MQYFIRHSIDTEKGEKALCNFMIDLSEQLSCVPGAVLCYIMLLYTLSILSVQFFMEIINFSPVFELICNF